MKKSLLISAFVLLMTCQAESQSRFIRNVANDVKNELLGSSSGSSKQSTQPEPSCACSDAQQVLGMSENKLMYTEIDIEMMEDGSFLIQDRMSQNYYIIKDGVKKGPYASDDARVTAYTNSFDTEQDMILARYGQYISKSGDKYNIKFNGKTYGPYARIDNFTVTKSGDKFAALAIENIVTTESDGEKMEAAMKNAKSDQERMELAMQFSQQMTSRMMAGGGPESMLTKLVTNIDGATFNPMMGGILKGNIKFDDIVYLNRTDVVDLKDKKLISINPEHAGLEKIYVNSSNSVYAAYQSGTLYMSNGKTLSDLFNPYLVKTDGKVSLAYMYYSPKKDAIMQCKIPF
ncbi:MAG TPA: hypothetical protein VK213_07715 [Bacteroidales bacterium]|nr:hypothetical protein [Bacteroidales bacterium]